MTPSSSSGATATFYNILPSLRRQLADCFGDLAPPQQVVAMAALQRCDDEVAKAISDIVAAQNKVISELREIMMPSIAPGPSSGSPSSDVHAERSPLNPRHPSEVVIYPC